MKKAITTLLALAMSCSIGVAQAESVLSTTGELIQLRKGLLDHQGVLSRDMERTDDQGEYMTLNGLYSGSDHAGFCLDSVIGYLEIYSEITHPSDQAAASRVIKPKLSTCSEVFEQTIKLNNSLVNNTPHKSTRSLGNEMSNDYRAAQKLMMTIKF